jgi:hypothetical protein
MANTSAKIDEEIRKDHVSAQKETKILVLGPQSSG